MNNQLISTLFLSSISNIEKEIETWYSFIDSIDLCDKVGVVFHADLDGLVGGVYVKLFLEKLEKKLNIIPYWVATEEFDFTYLSEWVKESNLDHIIFTDISIENNPEILDRLTEYITKNIFIYDHHIIKYDASLNKRTFLINPTPKKLAAKEKPIPTFLFAYILAKGTNLIFPAWLLITSIFDEGLDDYFKEELKELFKIDPGYEIDITVNLRQWYKTTQFSKIGLFIKSEFDCREKHYIAFDSLYKTINENKEFNSFFLALQGTYSEQSEQISKEITWYVDTWGEIIELNSINIHNACIVIPVPSKFRIIGPIASIIRGRYPNNIIITYAYIKDAITLEFRTRNDTKLHLVEILKNVFSQNKITPFNYGGHPSAAGASIKKEDLKIFISLFLSETQKSIK